MEEANEEPAPDEEGTLGDTSPVRGADERQAAIAALLASCSTENAPKPRPSVVPAGAESSAALAGAAVGAAVAAGPVAPAVSPVEPVIDEHMAGLVISCKDCGCDITLAEIDDHNCQEYTVCIGKMGVTPDKASAQTSTNCAYSSPVPQSRSVGITVASVEDGRFTEIVRVAPTGPAATAGVLVGRYR